MRGLKKIVDAKKNVAYCIYLSPRMIDLIKLYQKNKQTKKTTHTK